MNYSTDHFEFTPIAKGTPEGLIYDPRNEEFIVSLYQDPNCSDAFRPNTNPYVVQSINDLIIKFPGYEYYLIWDKGGVNAGLFYYFPLDKVARSVECGWVLTQDYRGHGSYSVEVGLGAMKFLFEHENFRRIQLKVLDTNPYLKTLFLDHGFYHEGTLREAAYRSGEYIDVHVLSILKKEYLVKYKKEK